ncbi:class I SAM-dependent methyltransferase [Alkalinema pantanalense CENA528]|uniref:class I SAM-dependent methyltransferase n=1 Tax=Alkalinema pantanalense TaxID=1620705 RepID=UPI003D6DF2FB
MTNPIPAYELNPTGRFSDRASDYHHSRPSYPAAVIDRILSHLALDFSALENAATHPQPTAADIGAGTGISARLLADRGLQVWAVEPNAAMRAMGQQATGQFNASVDSAGPASPPITLWDGTAEATGLPTASMDVVTAFQAFHWFQPDRALAEFHRILKPTGRVAIVWNNRDRSDEFTALYGQLVKQASSIPDLAERRDNPQPLYQSPLFTHTQHYAIAHAQSLDLVGLLGLAKSRSYVPLTGETHDRLMADLTQFYHRFANHQGQVHIQYQTNLYLATPQPADP